MELKELMRGIISLFTILFVIGGCSYSYSRMMIEEESVIPTNKLKPAYEFVNNCVTTDMSALTSGEDNESLSDILVSRETTRIKECLDNMFILYGITEYTVVRKSIDGSFTTICKSRNVDTINKCIN